MFELSKDFRFDAAHTLTRSIGTESSRRIHGHSYRAQVVVRGTPDPETGMVIDLSALETAMSTAREGLDHQFLDEVPDLGPATMENLAVWVWRTLGPHCQGLTRVIIHRDASGESCTYLGEGA